MVSKEISDACYPLTVKMGREMKDGTLVLNVIHGKELDVEYKKNEIIDKINSFFGYNCIRQVTLKVTSNKIIKHNKVFHKIKDLKQIDEKIKRVDNNHLKNSLSNFLKAYNERNK